MNQLFTPDIRPSGEYSTEERQILEVFATNIDGYASVIRNLPPEVAGALISRASRSTKPLLRVLLDECILPLLNEQDEASRAHAISVMQSPAQLNSLLVQWGRKFYSKWYGEYGDDSIGQVTGAYLVYPLMSQIAIKHIQDQRIGIEPIEKSTRYVDYGKKVNGRYLYYIPKPHLPPSELDLYCTTMDMLFTTYADLTRKFIEWLRAERPSSPIAMEKKAFDTLRGLLPMATMSQLALRGNAQALEMLLNRSLLHPCGEVRFFAQETHKQLLLEIPSLMGRMEGEKAAAYREYMKNSQGKIAEWVGGYARPYMRQAAVAGARLMDFDPDAEAKVIAGLLYEQMPGDWNDALVVAKNMIASGAADPFLDDVFKERSERWMKVPRALENAFVRFEIVMNIGAWRDLHRHRMHTQQRQDFSTRLGYAVPEEVVDAKLEEDYCNAMDAAETLYQQLLPLGQHVAQYAVPLGFNIRFQQYQNFREIFWEVELRTGSQGHPDYRKIEQEKYTLLSQAYPLLARHIKADMGDYYFARR